MLLLLLCVTDQIWLRILVIDTNLVYSSLFEHHINQKEGCSFSTLGGDDDTDMYKKNKGNIYKNFSFDASDQEDVNSES